MDLLPFYAAHRQDGHGRAAHDPAMMVALLLYAYATGRRSSRAIERPAKWPSGSHSRTSGGIKNACSRSQAMKFCAITEAS
jgi:transposase-like protein DUF772